MLDDPPSGRDSEALTGPEPRDLTWRLPGDEQRELALGRRVPIDRDALSVERWAIRR